MRDGLSIGILADGILVISERLRGRRIQCFEVRVGTGYGSDPESACGLAHLVEHLVLRRADGTPLSTRTRSLEELGARPTAATARDFTSFGVTVPNDQAAIALDELHRMILQPELSVSAVEAEQRIIAAERAIQQGDPLRALSRVAEKHLFSQRSMAPGTSEWLAGAHRFWSDHYRPGNITIFTSGPANTDALGLATGARQHGSAPPKTSGATSASPAKLRVLHIRKADTQRGHTHLLSCYTVPNRSGEHRAVANVLVALLGGGFSSLLVRQLRTDRQLSYSPRTFYTDYGTIGLISAFATVATSDEDAAARAMADAMHDLASDPLLAERVDVAKAHLRTGTLIAYDDLPRRVSALASSWERRRRFSPAEVIRAIDRIRPASVAALAGVLSSSPVEFIGHEDESGGIRWHWD
ncbi:insulinase family protein [Leifsonia sp. fls2-241-R2A-40a]|uniref:M16 family metallopeptidase n=1 Tax=Leifsonia sp. fls2-241-R2A-40a TaxID=3040290 RepID=UPI0025515C18|nr:insulinase family protein [Leifsonia sp. fls2-241-R2A-40a]